MSDISNTIIAACAASSIISGILVAAAKSIFVLKSKIYAPDGMPFYLSRLEFEKTMESRERRIDAEQRNILHKIELLQVAIDKTTTAQNDTNRALTRLLGQLDHLLRE